MSNDGRFVLSFSPENSAPTRFAVGADAARGIAETIQTALGETPAQLSGGPAH